jgi:hypothetical protein
VDIIRVSGSDAVLIAQTIFRPQVRAAEKPVPCTLDACRDFEWEKPQLDFAAFA